MKDTDIFIGDSDVINFTPAALQNKKYDVRIDHIHPRVHVMLLNASSVNQIGSTNFEHKCSCVTYIYLLVGLKLAIQLSTGNQETFDVCGTKFVKKRVYFMRLKFRRIFFRSSKR